MIAPYPHFPPENRRPDGHVADAHVARRVRSPEPSVLLLRDRPGAGELKYLLLPLIEGGGTARIDASAVEKLPMPALQVILSAAATLQAKGARLCLENASSAFTQSFEALGFPKDLRLPQDSERPAPDPMGSPSAAVRQGAQPVMAITIRSHDDCFSRAIDIRNILTGLEGFGVLAVKTSLARLPPLARLDSALCFLDFDIALKSEMEIRHVDDFLALQLGRGAYAIAPGFSDAAFTAPHDDEGSDLYWHSPPVLRRIAPAAAQKA
jgi:anti-anti-sigma regulatory factor